MSKRAAIYARVSTDMQRENYSIPSQIAACLQYSRDRKYSIVGDQFVDPQNGLDANRGNGSIPAYVDDYSSRELSRPKLDEAIRYLETIGFDVLIVYSLDRLARDQYIRQTLERELSSKGAKVEYVLVNYEDSAQGEVRKDLDATFAKWENAVRVERSNRGKMRKAQIGLFVTGPAPYGYMFDEKALAGLAIDEKEAEVVRWIFDLYVNQNHSIHDIILALDVSDIPSPTGLDSWAPTSVKRLLKNPLYIGKLHYNKTKLLANKKREDRGEVEWVEIPTTPIVDSWTFEMAQQRFHENMERKRRQPKRFYLLGGKIICDDCERPYITQTYNIGKQRRKSESQIYRHRVSCGHCSNKSILAKVIEPMVWDEIVRLLKDPQRLMEGYQEAVEQQQAMYSRHQAHLELLRKKLSKLEQRRKNLNIAYIDPEIQMTKAEYLEQKETIDAEWNSIVREIEHRQAAIVEIPTPEELESLETFSREVCQRLDLIDPPAEEKRKILDILHVKVRISTRGEIRLEGWFNPDYVGGSIGPRMSIPGKP